MDAFIFPEINKINKICVFSNKLIAIFFHEPKLYLLIHNRKYQT